MKKHKEKFARWIVKKLMPGYHPHKNPKKKGETNESCASHLLIETKKGNASHR